MVPVSRNPQRYVYFPQPTLQVLALSDHGRQRPVGFLLPTEIRDSIRELVLVPGEIQFHATDTDEKPIQSGLLRGVIGRVYKYLSKSERLNSSSILQPLLGLQVLATCKQACAEGYDKSFSKNTFYLPWGPIENVRKCFEENRVGHRSTIQSVSLMLGLQDLDLAGFEKVERDIKVLLPSGLLDGLGPAGRPRGIWWGAHVEIYLEETWEQKLKWLRARAIDVKFKGIGNVGQVVEFQGKALEDALTTLWREDGTEAWPKSAELRFLVQDTRRFVRDEAVRVVSRVGWKAFKAMVKKRVC